MLSHCLGFYISGIVVVTSMAEWNIYVAVIGRNRGSSIDVEDGMGQIPRGRLANLRFRRETSDIHASESHIFEWWMPKSHPPAMKPPYAVARAGLEG